jgi:hypothetical protein
VHHFDFETSVNHRGNIQKVDFEMIDRSSGGCDFLVRFLPEVFVTNGRIYTVSNEKVSGHRSGLKS